jgi:hemolysin activation/secretion protein
VRTSLIVYAVKLALLTLPPTLLIAETVQAAAPAARFDIQEFRVLGNSTLPTTAVESAVYPHLGPDRSLEDVEAARQALELAYRTAGFGTVYVDIPEQDVDDGIVRLKVTEGRLGRVRVEGARYFSGRRLVAALPGATPATVPDLPTLQRDISTLNTRTPDLSVVPVLGAGSRPGTVDLTLKVADELPVHGSVEVNDQYTADTTRTRFAFSLSYDNLFDRLDSVSLQYQTAPQDRSEVDVFVASYVRALEEGRRLAFYYVDSNSEVAALGTLSVLGKGKVYGTKLILPLVNSSDGSHTLTLGADYKDFVEDIRLDPTSTFQTPISYTNLSLGHTSAWRGPAWQWSLGSTLNFGSRSLGNSTTEFADKGFKSRPNYFYLRTDASVVWSSPWPLTVTARLAGQYAIEPVISNEQYAVGGADGVRGYLEAAALGDIGYKASLQFESRPWSPFAALKLSGFAFVDSGRVATIAPLPDEERATDLRSWGVGVGLAAIGFAEGTLSWARPLLAVGRTEAGDSRLLFRLRAAW